VCTCSELAKYENPHTPSSARRIKEKSKSRKSKRRGAPKGHKGATRQTLEPDESVEVKVEHCKLCGGTDLEDKGVEREIIFMRNFRQGDQLHRR
jgi:hypothetical protein